VTKKKYSTGLPSKALDKESPMTPLDGDQDLLPEDPAKRWLKLAEIALREEEVRKNGHN
jgi:hypothetical protein